MLHHTRFAVMVGLLALRVAQGTAAPASVTDDVSFSSRGQNLYSPADTGVDTHEIGFRVIDEKNELLRAGEIRTVPVDVPASTLQAKWDKALAQCMSTCFETTLGQICPTRDECIDGKIDRCLVPNPLGGCLTRFTRDLGPGIGPRPTQGATRSFDIGMELVADTEAAPPSVAVFEDVLHDDAAFAVAGRASA